MGLTISKIMLSNPTRNDLASVEAEVFADTGGLHLCIPNHVRLQLNLDRVGDREVTLPDGSKQLVPYVGPIKLEFMNRSGFTGALVLGNQVLIGTIPMKDMDLVVIPSTRTLAVHPDRLIIPASG